jgi:hypothetical protein
MRKFSPPGRMLILSTWAPPMIGGPENLYNIFSQFDPPSLCIMTSYQALMARSSPDMWLDCDYYFFDRPHLTSELARTELEDQDLH